MLAKSRIFKPLNLKVMLWSQIKLTSYDFTDLHINGEFINARAPDDF